MTDPLDDKAFLQEMKIMELRGQITHRKLQLILNNILVAARLAGVETGDEMKSPQTDILVEGCLQMCRADDPTLTVDDGHTAYTDLMKAVRLVLMSATRITNAAVTGAERRIKPGTDGTDDIIVV